MTQQEYQAKLDAHDWFYEMSDDYRVWSQGHAMDTYLKQLAAERPILADLYQKKAEQVGADLAYDYTNPDN